MSLLSLEFLCGANNNFNLLLTSFYEHIICFGLPGKEILTNTRLYPREPTPDDLDSKGKRRYALVKPRMLGKGEAADSDEPEMTDAADRRFVLMLHFFMRYCCSTNEILKD